MKRRQIAFAFIACSLFVAAIMAQQQKSATPESKSGASTVDSPPKNLQKTTVKDFVFQIDSCAVSKRSVVCEPTVINTSAQDQEILMSVAGADYSDDLGKMTRIVDGFGVEYIPKDIHLGSASKKFGAGLGVCCPDSVARGAACSFGGCSHYEYARAPGTNEDQTLVC